MQALRRGDARSTRRMLCDGGQILPGLQSRPMTAADFRKIALSLDGVEEYSHAGLPDKEGRPQIRAIYFTSGKIRQIRLSHPFLSKGPNDEAEFRCNDPRWYRASR